MYTETNTGTPPFCPAHTDRQETSDNALVRRTFLLSERADRALNRIVALNKMNDKKPISVSALLRLIIDSHISLDAARQQASYSEYNPLSFNLALTGSADDIKTLEDYRQRRADKTNRTFTLLKKQLAQIEHLAAKNRYERSGPQTVNALLLHLVNEHLQEVGDI